MKSDLKEQSSGEIYINNSYKDGCIAPDQEILLCIKFEGIIIKNIVPELLSGLGEKRSFLLHNKAFHTKYDASEMALNGTAIDLCVKPNKKYKYNKIIKALKSKFEPLDSYLADGVKELFEFALSNGIKIAIFTESDLFEIVEQSIRNLGFLEHYARPELNDIIILSGVSDIKECIQTAMSHYKIDFAKNIYFLSKDINMHDLCFNSSSAYPISASYPNYFTKAQNSLKIHLAQKQDYIDHYKKEEVSSQSTTSQSTTSKSDTTQTISDENVYLPDVEAMGLGSENNINSDYNELH